MQNFYSAEFHLRPVFILIGALFLISCAFPRVRKLYLDSFHSNPARARKNELALIATTGVYFLIALLCKYTQLKCRTLSGNDFWLFEDMLRSLAGGQPYITRFTDQAVGPFQHGVVHAFLSIWIFVPLVYIFGATLTAIMILPLSLAAGGYLIGKTISQRSNSCLLIIGLPLAFWMSEWTNRILLYETHPEALYIPLGFAAYLLTLRLHRKTNVINYALFISAWACLAGIKQDAIVMAPFLWAFLIYRKQMRLTPALISGGLIVGLFCLMTMLIANFKSGALGSPTFSVGGLRATVSLVSTGSVNLDGRSLSNLSGLIDTAKFYIGNSVVEMFSKIGHYLFFSQFTVITLIAPWVWLKRSFWILVVPFAVVIGLMHNAFGNMQIYNSAISLSLLWVCIASEATSVVPTLKTRTLFDAFAWTFVFCCLHGGASPNFLTESVLSKQVSAETVQVMTTLKGPGVVSTRLLNDADKDRVWGIVPATPNNSTPNPPDIVKWIIYPKENPSYEFGAVHFDDWRLKALSTGTWKLVQGTSVDLLVRK